jgi:hypothetical protein
MSTHNELKQLRTSLEQVAIQGRALLSCENINEEDVAAYKDIVNGVLAEGDMRLEDVDALAAARAIERQELEAQTTSLEAVEEEEEETPPAEDEKVEEKPPVTDAEEETPPAEESEVEIEVPELNDSVATADEVEAGDAAAQKQAETDSTDLQGNDVGPEDLEADTVVEDVDTEVTPDVQTTPVSKTPAEDLEETVDKVDHVVERVSTFISVTEDSGLNTDDVQAMAQTNDSFESISVLNRFSKAVSESGSSAAILAFNKLAKITIRNIGKLIK